MNIGGSMEMPTKIPIKPFMPMDGSCSGIGGMSSVSCQRFPGDMSNRRYVPGSYKFFVPSRGYVHKALGTWGGNMEQKVNIHRTTAGVAGYLNQGGNVPRSAQFGNFFFSLFFIIKKSLHILDAFQMNRTFRVADL